MSIVCIKVGENEKNSYAKFNRLSQHLDIIDVLPRKRDKNGALLNRTMGVMGDKEFLGINVDMSDLSDFEFEIVRTMLKEEWLDEVAQPDGTKGIDRIQQRLRRLDLSPSVIGHIGLSQPTVTKITGEALKKRNKQPYDMTTINKFHKVIPFEKFAKCVINKETNKTLEQELNLSGKKLKQVVNTIRLRRV